MAVFKYEGTNLWSLISIKEHTAIRLQLEGGASAQGVEGDSVVEKGTKKRKATTGKTLERMLFDSCIRRH